MIYCFLQCNFKQNSLIINNKLRLTLNLPGSCSFPGTISDSTQASAMTSGVPQWSPPRGAVLLLTASAVLHHPDSSQPPFSPTCSFQWQCSQSSGLCIRQHGSLPKRPPAALPWPLPGFLMPRQDNQAVHLRLSKVDHSQPPKTASISMDASNCIMTCSGWTSYPPLFFQG